MYIKNILGSFLCNITFSVKINSSFSNKKSITAGVPQGSILGPLLFNIYMSDITIPPLASLALYVDDTVIVNQDTNILTASLNLQNSVQQVVQWFSKWIFRLNPSKCEAKIFTLKNNQPPPEILINDKIVNWNPPDVAVKYLGVHFDKKLNWNYHVNSKLTQAYSRLSILFPILNRKSSLKSQ